MSAFRVWALRFNTSDYPDQYVARLFVGEKPTESVIVSRNLDLVRRTLTEMHLVSLQPMEGDESNLIETWL